MDKDTIAVICLSVFGIATIIGILWTKAYLGEVSIRVARLFLRSPCLSVRLC